MHIICKELIVNGAYEVHTMWTRVLLPYSSDSVASREKLPKVVPLKLIACTPDDMFNPRTILPYQTTSVTVSTYYIDVQWFFKLK